MLTQRIRYLPMVFIMLIIISCQISSPLAKLTPSGGDESSQPSFLPGSPTNLPFENAQKSPDAKLDWFQKFTDNPQDVYYSITFTSSNSSQAQFNSAFQITAFDASGSKLGENRIYTGWILPGKTLHQAGLMNLNTSGEVAHLEITAQDPVGQLAAVPGGKNGILAADANASFVTISNQQYIVGTIHNLMDKTLTKIDVVALAYDPDGKIVDASAGYLDFIPAGKQTAVQVQMHVKKQPARVELFPSLNNNAEIQDVQPPPITLEKAGALKNFDGQMEAIYILKNNTGFAYNRSAYIISLYDAQGKALAATSNSNIEFISPGSRCGMIDRIGYPAGTTVARMDVQVLPRSEKDGYPALTGIGPNPVLAEQVLYKPGVNQDNKVTAMIINPSQLTLDQIGVAAVLYNDTGQIIGGGSTSVGILTAAGRMQVEIPVDVKGTVTRTEAIPFFYNTPTGLVNSKAQVDRSSNPQATPTFDSKMPEVLSKWFSQSSSDRAVVNIAFLVENPNPDVDLVRSEYQVLAYDKAGLTLSTRTVFIDLLPAGQKMAEVDTMIVKDTDTVDKIEIIPSQPGESQAPTNPQRLLSAGQVKYTHYRDWDIVSGLIKNSQNQEMDELGVNALVFDANEQIIGAGKSDDSYFAPGNSQVPMAIRVETKGTVARAEFYPFSQSINSNQPENSSTQPLKILTAGFVQNPQSTADITLAFVIDNPNPDQAIYAAHYEAALYDQTGALLATHSGNIPSLVHPRGQTAFIDHFNVSGEIRVAKADVLISQGKTKTMSDKNPLKSDKVNYYDQPYPKITALVTNSSRENIKQVNAIAIIYDQDKHIIGGGNTTLDNVPANSQVPVELMVTSYSPPGGIEIYLSEDTFGMNP
jgi:hypothetical protein